MTTIPRSGKLCKIDFEIEFLQDLRFAVGVDSYEAALKAAAVIPLYNVLGALFSIAQVLSYVTRVAKFFTEVSMQLRRLQLSLRIELYVQR